jgi:hypothetical protein
VERDRTRSRADQIELSLDDRGGHTNALRGMQKLTRSQPTVVTEIVVFENGKILDSRDRCAILFGLFNE